MIAPRRTPVSASDTCSESSAKAGSYSSRMLELTMPTPSRAPATTWGSLLYRYLSSWGRPPSTSHMVTMPRLAVAAALPWSLFLKIQCTLSPPLLPSSGTTVMSLSCPKPAFTNAFTNVLARFARAESNAGAEEPRVSTRCALYTSSGVRGAMRSKSRARARKRSEARLLLMMACRVARWSSSSTAAAPPLSKSSIAPWRASIWHSCCLTRKSAQLPKARSCSSRLPARSATISASGYDSNLR
mmetsp:Transcript_16474/g.49336  ORF Transcript_16474/g.49336 Transcript_16474/m.49336 type:complete len:243 (-) Transcript_16474:912-1640(-)